MGGQANLERAKNSGHFLDDGLEREDRRACVVVDAIKDEDDVEDQRIALVLDVRNANRIADKRPRERIAVNDDAQTHARAPSIGSRRFDILQL